MGLSRAPIILIPFADETGAPLNWPGRNRCAAGPRRSYRYRSLVTMKRWLPSWLFLLCGCLCIGAASCSTSTAVRRCIRTGDAEVCGNRTGAGIVLEAKGLKPGSTVNLSSAATGSTEATVGADGHLAGAVGISAFAADTVVAVTASTANGEPLAGELSFPKL